MDVQKLDRLFFEAARSCDQIPKDDLDYALKFQRYASESKGKSFPLDRILLKFGFLVEEQIHALYTAIRYYTWRKEDKFFLKIATQSRIMSQRKADNCLLEQKNLFRDHATLMRVNEIARRRVYMTEKQETRIIEAMRDCRTVTMSVTKISLENPTVARLASKSKLRSRPSRSKGKEAVAPKTKAKAFQETVPDSEFNRSDSSDDMFSGSGFAPIDSFESDGASLGEASGFAPVDSMTDSDEFGGVASFADSGSGSFSASGNLAGLAGSSSFADADSGLLGNDPFGDSFESDGFTDEPQRGGEDSFGGSQSSPSDASFGSASGTQGFSFADDDSGGFADSEFGDERSEFSALTTEDDLDSILPLHEDDAIDNLAGMRGRRAKASKGKAAPPVGGRSDPFLDSQDPGMDLISDDELDALWDDTQIDKLELESGSQKSNRASPLLDSEFGDSSDDDFF